MTADAYIAPLKKRVDSGVTLASWKRSRVRDRLDAGRGFAEAVRAAQAGYVERQRGTLLEGHFVDCLE